jgi:hypothetical protein
VTEDLHSPTTAGPEPATVPGASDSTFTQPPGSAVLDSAPVGAGSPLDRPEVRVGAAFAGGFMAALLLKRLGR